MCATQTQPPFRPYESVDSMIRAGADASLAEGRLAVAQQPCRRISLMGALQSGGRSSIVRTVVPLAEARGVLDGWRSGDPVVDVPW